MLPYVYVSGDVFNRTFRLGDMLKNGNNQLFVRYQQYLETPEGYTSADSTTLADNPNARYLGNQGRLYTRYRYTYYNNVSFGVTGEKDQGEEFFKGTQKNGYDFYSAHFYLKNAGILKSLALGDYHVQFGQGLTFWSGIGFGKSADAVSVRKNATGIRPYTSVDENLFMRGIAGTIALKGFEFSAFFSYKKRDGSLTQALDTLDNEEDQIFVTSMLETGYHRTPSELEKKHSLGELIYGGNLTYRRRAFSVGATAVRTELSHELNRDLYLYNQFDFSGKENLNTGIDYSYIFRNISFFGEVSRSQNGALGYLNGAVFSLDPRLSLSVLHRHYDIDFQSLYTTGFGESSNVANEDGLFIGLMATPVPAWKFTAFADNFSSPWLKYRVNAPSRGFDYLVQATYKPSKTFEMYARYRNKTKSLNNSDVTSGIYYPEKTEKENYRYEVKYKVSDDFLLKNRLEYITYAVGSEAYKGFTIYQDVQYKPRKKPFSVTLRYALFDTDNYDTRIYVYENDVLYASSFPSYYYKGSRTYVLVNYDLSRHVELWLRWAQTYYSDHNTIGSGLDEIKSNTRNEIKVQLRVKF
ncbi:MAG: hypothetical protein BWY70_01319 [Bacteroidetes bacterium ADurb.Bin408]|nr:MAG: hypothetical protein BWY70_01319 [Bacteroidetes bacterium ADurb.Bin408]